jgi:hypothetical protein
MKKDISLHACIDRAKTMLYLMAVSAFAYLTFVVLASL